MTVRVEGDGADSTRVTGEPMEELTGIGIPEAQASLTVPCGEEAALLDGCGRLAALAKVTLPLAVPGVITAVIFTFIAAWNEFIVALTLTTDADTQPLTVGITSFIGEYQVQWQYLFAASLVAVVPVVVLFAFIERYLVSGLTAGSIKG